jgi:large subunit ribosomal protein L9
MSTASIEILLREDVKTLGNRGEIVKVTKGYARNYLFPHKLAILPTKENLLELEREKRRKSRIQENMVANFTELVPKIENASCTIEVKANEEGILFGSITPQMIIDALARENISGIKEAMIVLNTPIKELGVYRIQINLYQNISTICRLWIVEESEPKSEGISEDKLDKTDLDVKS